MRNGHEQRMQALPKGLSGSQETTSKKLTIQSG
jgi:hypothetical protein